MAPDAQKTDGQQMSRALLLSRKAEADAKPELEIYADDVLCAHGATVGELDETQLFYLTSRGIDRQKARAMLISAFLDDAIDSVSHAGLADMLRPVTTRMDEHASAVGVEGAMMNVNSVKNMEEQGIDVEKIRRDFPILSREVHGKPLVYLDSAASAQKPQQVIDALVSAYSDTYSNVHRGLHFLSEASTDAYEAVRGKVAQFIGAQSGDEIVLTAGATMSLNLIAQCWAMPRLQAGDEILISIAEHHANIVPWQMVAEKTGAVLRAFPVDEDGSFNLVAFNDMMSSRTQNCVYSACIKCSWNGISSGRNFPYCA